MTKINTIDDLHNNIHHLPSDVIKDIEKRLADSLASGGTIDDNYAKQQFRYAENVLNRRKEFFKTRGEAG
jgi:hypothetical protein